MRSTWHLNQNNITNNLLRRSKQHLMSCFSQQVSFQNGRWSNRPVASVIFSRPELQPLGQTCRVPCNRRDKQHKVCSNLYEIFHSVLMVLIVVISSQTPNSDKYRFLFFIFFFFTFGSTGAKCPSAGCPECICNRPRPWCRPCGSDWGCGAVILLSRGEFGREKNKICYQRGGVWTFCYMPNLQYNIVILQHIFILRNNRCERSYFVFNLGSFARNRECETQVCVFGAFFGNIC